MRILSRQYKVEVHDELGYGFDVKLHSYKDGDVEMEIVNHKLEVVNSVLVENPNKYSVERTAFVELIKYLNIERGISISKGLKAKIKKALYQAFELAMELKGAITSNYRAYECHAKILFVEKTGTKNV